LLTADLLLGLVDLVLGVKALMDNHPMATHKQEERLYQYCSQFQLLITIPLVEEAEVEVAVEAQHKTFNRVAVVVLKARVVDREELVEALVQLRPALAVVDQLDTAAEVEMVAVVDNGVKRAGMAVGVLVVAQPMADFVAVEAGQQRKEIHLLHGLLQERVWVH
jgi:hypothetical protein